MSGLPGRSIAVLDPLIERLRRRLRMLRQVGIGANQLTEATNSLVPTIRLIFFAALSRVVCKRCSCDCPDHLFQKFVRRASKLEAYAISPVVAVGETASRPFARRPA